MRYTEGGKVYVNIGEWMHAFSYGKLDKGRLSLEYWGDE
jgi:hypothetical protein